MLKAAGRAGGACAFAGCVGDDANGAKLAECARAGGVEVAYQVDAEAPPGVCGVLVDPTNERTLVTRLDAANNFTKDHLETAAVQKRTVASKVVYSAGFFLTSGGPDCTALLGQHCADFGKRFCLNISAPFIAPFFGEALGRRCPSSTSSSRTRPRPRRRRGPGLGLGRRDGRAQVLRPAQGLGPRALRRLHAGADSTIVPARARSRRPVTPLAKPPSTRTARATTSAASCRARPGRGAARRVSGPLRRARIIAPRLHRPGHARLRPSTSAPPPSSSGNDVGRAVFTKDGAGRGRRLALDRITAWTTRAAAAF